MQQNMRKNLEARNETVESERHFTEKK